MTYQITTLPSGLRVASETLPGVESVAISVAVGVGARYEKEEENGISHLLEHMAFKGTPSRSAREIAESFDAIGGQFNAYTSTEQTVYYAKVLKEHLPVAVDIIADILLNSLFDETELKREEGVILQEIAMHLDAPDDLIFDHFDATAFPDQPLGRSILGSAERVSNYSQGDVIHYMQRYYIPQRMVISAAGNVQHAALLALAERYFSGLKEGEVKRPEPARYIGGESRAEDELEQLHLLFGFPALSVHDEDFYALQLYSSILGGGMSSRLFQEVREKRGLAYHVSSMVSAYGDCGTLSLYSATGPEHAATLPLLLADQLRQMADGVANQELARVKNQHKAELLMAKESPGAVAGWIAKHLLTFGEYRTRDAIIARIEAVSKEDIRRLAAQVVETKTPTLASLGPVHNLPAYEKIVSRLHG